MYADSDHVKSVATQLVTSGQWTLCWDEEGNVWHIYCCLLLHTTPSFSTADSVEENLIKNIRSSANVKIRILV